MKLYNIVEDSKLQKYIHDGAMAIIYRLGELRLLNHPFVTIAKEIQHNVENPLALLIELEQSIISAGVEAKEVEPNLIEYVDNHFTVIFERDATGVITEVQAFTVYNVWEIESERYSSENEDYIKLADKYYKALRN